MVTPRGTVGYEATCSCVAIRPMRQGATAPAFRVPEQLFVVTFGSTRALGRNRLHTLDVIGRDIG
jgi:hypothetical protein